MDIERLREQLKKSYEIADLAPKELQPNEINEGSGQKQNLIVPVLGTLGWDLAFEVRTEFHPEGAGGSH